jgi:hypothetical protein
MLGIDPSDSLLAGGVDFVGETLANPLTYLTGGTSVAAQTAGKAALKLGVPFTKAAVEIPGSARALGAIGGAAKAGYGKLPESVRQGVQDGLVNAKSALGWLKPATPGVAEALDAGDAARTTVNKSALAGAQDALQGMTDPEAEQLFRVIGNYKRTGEGPGDMVSELLPGSEMANAPYRLADDLAAMKGPVESDVNKIYRPDAYMQVRKPGMIQPVDELGREVGVTGVAVQDIQPIISDIVKDPQMMMGAYFNPLYADRAAAKTLQQAYPLVPTDPRFASGIDVANQALLAPGSGMRGIKTYGESAEAAAALPPKVKLPGENVINDPLTGTVTRTPVVPRNQLELPTSNTAAINEMMGGPAADIAKVTAENAPRATAPMIKLEDQLAQWNARIDALGKTPEETARLKQYAQKYLGYTHNDFVQKTKDIGALTPGIGDDVLTMIPQDYAHRRFTSMVPEEDLRLLGKNDASSIKKRTLKENEDLRGFLNSAEGHSTKLDENLISATTGLAGQAGRIAERATIAKGLLGDKFVSLADKSTGGLMDEVLTAMKSADPEGHRLLSQAWDGMGARGPIMDVLAKANSVFKPAAVYGLVFPRVGGIMKNILSFPAQLGMAGEGTAAAGQLAKTPATVYEAMRQGTGKAFGWKIPAGEVGAGVDLIEQAFKQSGGRAKNAEDFLRAQNRPDLADAIRLGVADGFVSREAVENTIRNSGWGRKVMSSIGLGPKAQDKAFDLIDAPAAAFQGAEQHARIGGFLDMVKRGRAPEEAAKAMRESLYDYAIKTGGNRTLRDIIPFAAFQTNAIRQSGKFIAKNPSVGVALGNASDVDPSEQYPWMSGNTNIPIGTSETGDQQYLTGLGLPTEALNSIPNLSGSMAETGQELRGNLLGNAHPLLKTAYSVLSGTDPRFDSAYGSYSKLPGNIEGGDFGSAYNQLAGTGLIQPLTTPLNQLGQLIDDRTSVGDKALNFLTGTRTVNVDQDRALTQRLQAYLKNNPDVSSYQAFFQQDKDPETQALIKALAEAKKRSKAKRELQTAN